MKRYFLLGFFGAPNMGDELLCQSLVHGISRQHEADFYIATRQPRITRSCIRGSFTCVGGLFPDPRFFLSLPHRIFAAARAERLLIGGGGLFNEYFSPASIMRCAFQAGLAITFNKPYDIVGIEMGNINTANSIELTRFAFDHAHSVWVRDEASVAKARRHSITRQIHLRSDLSHHLLSTYSPKPKPAAGRRFVINPLAIQHKQAVFLPLIDWALENHAEVVIAVAQPGEEKPIMSGLGPERSRRIQVFTSTDWQETFDLIAGADLCIAERFHYVLIGAHAGVPLIPLILTDKVGQVVENLGLASGAFQVSSVQWDELQTRCHNPLRVDRALLTPMIAACREGFDFLGQEPGVPSYSSETRRKGLCLVFTIIGWGLGQKWRAAMQKISRTFKRSSA